MSQADRKTPAPHQSACQAERWLDEHGDILYRYALQRTGEIPSAEDLVQETLLAAWHSRDTFRGEASERGWLLGILKHKIADEARRAKTRPTPTVAQNSADDIEAALFTDAGRWRAPPSTWGKDPFDHTQAAAFMQVLARCLDGVPETQRASFVLREIDELDTATVSHTLGVTTNNLYVLLHRARLRLRHCLERRWFTGAKP